MFRILSLIIHCTDCDSFQRLPCEDIIILRLNFKCKFQDPYFLKTKLFVVYFVRCYHTNYTVKCLLYQMNVFAEILFVASKLDPFPVVSDVSPNLMYLNYFALKY